MPKRLNHNDKVLASAIKAANKYGVAICLMYDIGSMDDSKYELVMEDWKHLVDDLNLPIRGAIQPICFIMKNPWLLFGELVPEQGNQGIFRKYLILWIFLRMIRTMEVVPFIWEFLRDGEHLGGIPKEIPRLHEVIKQADVIHPWLVGRFNEAEL